MKALFKGSLSFGLVTIDVALYSAIQEHVISFTLLCAKCKTPITYKRFCDHCNKEIQWNDVVKGLKLKNGSYYIFTQEQLKSLKPEKSPTIEITEFIDQSQLSIIYFDKHYYLAPQGKQTTAFSLFCQVLQKTGKVAVATFVMHDKEHVCSITPFKNILLLTTLHYAYEIRSVDSLEKLVHNPKINSAQLELAHDLVAKFSRTQFKLAAYKDSFAQKLLDAIKKGKSFKGLVQKRKAQITSGDELTDMLKKSVKKKKRL